MTNHQHRVEATARAVSKLRTCPDWDTAVEFAAWHLRHGGRAPGPGGEHA